MEYIINIFYQVVMDIMDVGSGFFPISNQYILYKMLSYY